MKPTFYLLAAILFVLLPGCSRHQNPAPGAPAAIPSGALPAAGTASEPGPPAAVKNVSISNFAYEPAELTVRAGETVIWTNADSAGHTVTSDEGNELDSPLLGPGESFSHAFSAPGDYDYFCRPHPWMKGRVMVGE